MSTALAALQNNQVATYGDEAFNALSIQGSFLPRLALYSSKSSAVQLEKIKANHWGVSTGKDQLKELGQEILVVPLAYRPMALDLRGEKAVSTYDFHSAQFKEITADSANKDSKCMSGIQFLLYVKDFGFASFYAASKSAKKVAPLIRALMNQYAKMGSHNQSYDKYVWRAPTIEKSHVVFDLDVEEAAKEVQKFISVTGTHVEEKDTEVPTTTTETGRTR